MSSLAKLRPRAPVHAPVLVVLTCALMGGCGPTDPDVDQVTLEGVWRSSVDGERENTVEIRADGTFDEVEALFPDQRCSTVSGTWSSDGAILSVTISSRNGLPVSEREAIPFDLTATTLTLNYVQDEPETLTRVGAMVDCPSYGWPTITLSATIDGVPITFEDHFAPVLAPGQTMADLIASGSLFLAGRTGSSAVPEECFGCRELRLELTGPPALTSGTYSMSSDNVSQLWARGFYTPDLSGTLDYWSDGSDPEQQAWQGEVALATATATEISGTFSFIGYDHLAPGPIVPSVRVTNGAFRIAFE